MPEGPDGKTIIIVKKVSGHGGHHGGAWKVAYADFVTAMMALFLTLWLVNSASVATREAIASYFKRPGVFELGSGTPLEIGGGGILPDTFAPPADSESQIVPHHRIYDEMSAPVEDEEAGLDNDEPGEGEKVEFEQLATELQQSVEKAGTAIQELLGQVAIKLDAAGLHLEIMDTPKASMFRLGSASIQDEAKETLKNIARTLAKLPNPVDIEGHTDARPFKGERAAKYDNWDLSTDRANAARRILEEAGVRKWQIARVVGYADQRLKVKEDPFAASNRRISLSMRYTVQAAEALKGTQAQKTTPLKLQDQALTGQVRPQKPKPKAQGPTMIDSPDIEAAIDGAVNGELSFGGEVTRDESSGLDVEVGAHLPEGATIERSDDVPLRKPWLKKDKIFDDDTPFFE